MSNFSRRLGALENKLSPPKHAPDKWHRLIWNIGQDFDDMLDDYGRDRIKSEDGVIIREVIDAEDGKPVPDPVHEACREKQALFSAQRRR